MVSPGPSQPNQTPRAQPPPPSTHPAANGSPPADAPGAQPASTTSPRPRPAAVPPPVPGSAAPQSAIAQSMVAAIPLPPNPAATGVATAQPLPARPERPQTGAVDSRATLRPVPTAKGARTRPFVLRETPRDPDEDLKRLALKQAPPWLLSTLVHMLLVIVLGLWAITGDGAGRGVVLNAVYDELGEQLENETVSLAPVDVPTKEPLITPSNLEQVNDPFAAPPKVDLSLLGAPAESDLSAPVLGLAFQGRDLGMKELLAKKFGATADSEAAVLLGLQWLARHQRKDGSWSLKGPYASGSQDPNDNPQAATAMALLAFLGAGHSHQSGEFKQQVAGGYKALVRWQARDGNFYPPEGKQHNWLYTQAQCTIAVCELYGMTKDSQIRSAAELAVKFCIEAQDPALGGWRYAPRVKSDTSVTGWMVMALQSAKMAGLEVPSPVWDKVSRFLDQVTADGSRYGYVEASQPTPSMTAEALLCRQYLGWAQDDPRLVAGADYLIKMLPRWKDRDVYYWYYGTQMMHHMEGNYWPIWNEALRDMLVAHQERTGPERGSWDPMGSSPDRWSLYGAGRLYCTCLSLYMLEVYYRHLPIYSKLYQQLAQP